MGEVEDVGLEERFRLDVMVDCFIAFAGLSFGFWP